MKSKFITWNTGALYRAEGQRIAATPIGGGTYMVDIDRGLEYFYPDCPCVKEAVNNAYLHNRHGIAPTEELRREMYELRGALEQFARDYAPKIA